MLILLFNIIINLLINYYLLLLIIININNTILLRLNESSIELVILKLFTLEIQVQIRHCEVKASNLTLIEFFSSKRLCFEFKRGVSSSEWTNW